jgi:hypothetical protein
MRALTSLLFKTTLSSMIITAPAMTTSNNDVSSVVSKEVMLPYYTAAVIKKFVNYNSLTPSPVYSEDKALSSNSRLPASLSYAPSYAPVSVTVSAKATVSASARTVNALVSAAVSTKTVSAPVPAALKTISAPAPSTSSSPATTFSAASTASERKAAELKMVINQAAILYDYMNLEQSGLDQKAFEYAWRGYHNLLKKGLIHKKTVLSICDFSQSSCSKRFYVIDVRHKKLLYRTYVAHGQNSGAEFASSFSNQPESFKSSLGFYVTRRTYWGRNGLSLKIEGVDTGYNDLAGKRNIVLHGSSYVSQTYMSNNGSIGTSLGCPAIPMPMSPRIIRAVKNGSCFFIYHPTQIYFEQSTVLNG